MVNFQKSSCNFLPTPTQTVIRQDVVELGAIDLKLGFDSGRPWESKVMYCSFEQSYRSWHKIADWQFLKIVWEIVCGIFSHLVFLITFLLKKKSTPAETRLKLIFEENMVILLYIRKVSHF